MILAARLGSLLFPPDPGALRLLAAFRATLAGALTFLLAMLLAPLVDISIGDRIMGFAIALFIAATLRDPTPQQRLQTIALAALAAFAAAALATLLIRQPLAAAAVVPPLMLAVAYGSTRQPRYGTVGIVALITYFISLVASAPANTLPQRALVLVLAAAVAALTLFVLLPVRPAAEVARLHRAIRAGIVDLLDSIAIAVAAGAWRASDLAALRRDVRRLNEAAMLAQTRLAALAPELPGQGERWLHLLTIGLATERVVQVAQRDLGTADDRTTLLTMLAAMRRGDRLPPGGSRAPLAVALALLDHAIAEAPQATLAPAAAPAADTGGSLRAALQGAIAAALAITVGELVSPSRWYWAAFAAYVMFQGTRSRAETLAKGLRFMAGTLIGVVAGTLAATLLHGYDLLSLIVIVVAVFLAFQANVAAYGVMVFWITVILGLLFGMLGYFPPELLLLRLQEAAVGAASGAVVAALVLVRDDHAATRAAFVAFLAALRGAVDGTVRTLLDDHPPPDVAARVLAGQQRFLELADAARAERTGLTATPNEGLRRCILLLGACEHWARELGALGMQSVQVHDATLAGTVRKVAGEIDRLLAALIEQADSPTTSPPDTAAASDELRQALADDPTHHAVRLLLRIAAALSHLLAQPLPRFATETK